MIDSKGIKSLDNYQLFKLRENESLSKDLSLEIEKEFKSRYLSKEEIRRLKQKFAVEMGEVNPISDKKHYPVLTPFLINRHWKNINKLKRNRLFDRARRYEMELYLGLILYFILILSWGMYTKTYWWVLF